jgi:hypothetical protein
MRVRVTGALASLDVKHHSGRIRADGSGIVYKFCAETIDTPIDRLAVGLPVSFERHGGFTGPRARAVRVIPPLMGDETGGA